MSITCTRVSSWAGGTIAIASKTAQPSSYNTISVLKLDDLSQSPLQPLLSFRTDLLDSHHFTVFSGATQHNARTARANKLAWSEVCGQDKAVLQGDENANKPRQSSDLKSKGSKHSDSGMHLNP
jgi:hypothetical protein